jgi:hypothetical protein
MGAGISGANRSARQLDLKPSIVEVKVKSPGQYSQVPLDSLLASCLDRVAGFRDQHAAWARTLFDQQSRAGDVLRVPVRDVEFRAFYELIGGTSASPSASYSAPPNSTKIIQLPVSAHLVLFSEDIKYPTLCDYLSKTKLELAPAHVLLATVLTNFKTTSYDCKSFDGSKVTTVEYHLDIPGPSYTRDRSVLAAGGYLRDDNGIERDALFGARTGSRGLEFFLPYTTNVTSGGWKSGTLFLVQPKRVTN